MMTFSYIEIWLAFAWLKVCPSGAMNSTASYFRSAFNAAMQSAMGCTIITMPAPPPKG